jgi:hypothetical protein
MPLAGALFFGRTAFLCGLASPQQRWATECRPPALHSTACAVSNMKNANTRETLDRIRTTVLENLQHM